MGKGTPIVLRSVSSTANSAEGRFSVGREKHVVHFDGVAPDSVGVADAFAAIGPLP